MGDDKDEIRDRLQSLAEEAFPDNTDVQWHVRGITQKAAFYCVEAEPVPATVGYPRFRFVLGRAQSGELGDHGCYCLDNGAWNLLYTTPNTSSDWRALGFDRANP
ncbi:MAG: hypothetical protein Q7R68_07275 [Nitrospirales bacterium]|nr:hypothetical protein [Nitrospirales bacterium]